MGEYKEEKMPNGEVWRFPSSMTRDQINHVKLRKFPPKTYKPEESFAKQLTRGPRNVGAAVNKLSNQFWNLPSSAAKMMGQPDIAETLAINPDFDVDKAWGLPKEKEWHDYLAQSAPEIAGGMMIPGGNIGAAGKYLGKIPVAGKYITKILEEGLPQAGYAGLTEMALHDSENAPQAAAMAGAGQAPFSAISQLMQTAKPGRQRALGLGVGALAGGLTGLGLSLGGAPGYIAAPTALGVGYLTKKGLSTKPMMMEEQTRGLNPEMARERLEAANRLGLDYITPGEASKNPFIGAEEGKLGRTPEGAEMKYAKSQQRIASEEKSINDTLDLIYNEEALAPQIQEGYRELAGYELPYDFAPHFEENDIIRHAQSKFESRPAYTQAAKRLPYTDEPVLDRAGNPVLNEETGIPETRRVASKNNVAYWDNIKKILQAEEKQAIKNNRTTEAYHIDQTRRELIDALDTAHSGYANVRNLSERQQVREDLEKAFDKTDIDSGSAFFKAIKSQKKFDEILHHLRNVPQAQQNLTDMRELFREMSPLPTYKGMKGVAHVGMNQMRNFGDWMTLQMDKLMAGKHDKDAIKFITSNDWHKQLEEVNKITDKQKQMAKVVEIFGRAVAQSGAKTKTNQPDFETENYDVYLGGQ